MKTQIKFLTLLTTLTFLVSCGTSSENISMTSNQESSSLSLSSEEFSSSISSSSEYSSSLVSSSSSSVNSSSSKSSSSSQLKDFTGITMEDLTVKYDGKSHTISPSNVPYGASTSYVGTRYYTNAGTYTITVKITQNGYNPLTLSATLTITPLELSKTYTMNDDWVIYDGLAHTIKINEQLGSNEQVSYRCLNASGTEFTNIGEYQIEASIKRDNYRTQTIVKTLTITSNKPYSKDASKPSLKINENLKWDDLYTALMNGNYTCETISYTWQEYPDGTTKTNRDNASQYNYACDGEKYFGAYISNDDSSYSFNEFTFAEIRNNYLVTTDYYVSSDGSHSVDNYIAPKEAFDETYKLTPVSALFTYLKKSTSGGFAENSVPGYYTNYGSYEIANNKFRLTISDNIYHTEFTNHEVTEYEFFNIGNTTVDLPKTLDFSTEEVSNFKYYTFTLNGVEYYFNNSKTSYWRANIYLSFKDKTILKPGEYEIFAEINGYKIGEITFDYRAYNEDYSGYTYLVHFDSSRTYQGQYESLGSVSQNYSALSKWTSGGGQIKYYGEWQYGLRAPK